MVICYCEECGRPLTRPQAARVGAYRRRIARLLIVMALTCASAGAVLTCVAMALLGAWKP